MSFLKVKRKCEQDPKEAFILACKKTKLENVTNESPIFELTNKAVQEEEIGNLINHTLTHRPSLQSRTFDIEKIRKKIREDNFEQSKLNKLKILNHVRKIDETVDEESVPVIDLSDDSSGKDENQNEYVFDLYYSNQSVDVSDPDFLNKFCIREVDDLFAENSMEDDDDANEDEDDSNDENNWRNDYPDEGETDSENDVYDFISNQMRHTHLNSDYSLSSDDYDENDYYERSNSGKSFDYMNEITSDTDSDKEEIS